MVCISYFLERFDVIEWMVRAHFIADRVVVDYSIYYSFNHWNNAYLCLNAYSLVPSKNAWRGAKIKTKAAMAAEADLLDGVIIPLEGLCPVWCDESNIKVI